jgi:hypothetical protein
VGAGPAHGQGTVAAVGGCCMSASGDRTGLHMGTISLLALAAAVYPQLLAVVVVILTRPSPRPLLWACYLGSVCVALSCGIAVLAIFRSSGSVAGTSSNRLGPSAYLVIGVIAIAVAILAATWGGRGVFGRDLPRLRRRDRNGEQHREP